MFSSTSRDMLTDAGLDSSWRIWPGEEAFWLWVRLNGFAGLGPLFLRTSKRVHCELDLVQALHGRSGGPLQRTLRSWH